MLRQVSGRAEQEVSHERSLRAAAEKALAHLRLEVEEGGPGAPRSSEMGWAPEPPAMAGPGYR